MASPTRGTTYIVNVSNQFGCVTKDSVRIRLIRNSEPFAGEDRTICEGGDTQFNLNYGTEPEWMVTEGLSCTFCPNPVAQPNETTTYVVKVRSEQGCMVEDSVTVNVRGSEDIDAGPDLRVCPGSNVMLMGVGEGEVRWTPNVAIDDPEILNPSVNPERTRYYYMQVEQGECVLRDSVLVEVSNQTSVSLPDLIVCEGDTVSLIADGQVDAFEWRLLNGDEVSDATEESPLVVPSGTTDYILVGRQANCQAARDTGRITVLPIPENSLLPIRQYAPGQAFELNYSDPDTNGYAYTWFPIDNLSCVDCPKPTVTPTEDAIYELEVFDPLTGCTNTKSIELKQLEICTDDLINAPNIFTPNEDGQNDEFGIFLATAQTGIESFKIFTRWGELVFATNDPNARWNGFVNGKEMPMGVYMYVVEAVCPINGQLYYKTGDFTLVK